MTTERITMSHCIISSGPFKGLCTNRYKVLYVDPPWKYYGDPNKDQAAGKHYSCMSLDELSSLPLYQLWRRDAVCFLWTSGPQLATAIDLLRAWGLHYRGIAYVWIKTRADGEVIHGQGVRPTLVKQMAELVLSGTTNPIGRPIKIYTERQSQWVFANRPGNKHSAKPPEVRDRIVELVGSGTPRIELFARERSKGWHVWGNEV